MTGELGKNLITAVLAMVTVKKIGGITMGRLKLTIIPWGWGCGDIAVAVILQSFGRWGIRLLTMPVH